MSTIGAQDTMLNVITTEALPATNVRDLNRSRNRAVFLAWRTNGQPKA